MNRSRFDKYLAEAIGTFALVFVGAGTVIMESHTGASHAAVSEGKVGLLGIALAHGMILSAMIYALGATSGAHFNPAVSFAMWLRRRLEPRDLGSYVASQLGGAVVAALLLAVLFPDEVALAGLGTPALAPRVSIFKGLVLEAIITFFLVLVILLSTREKKGAGEFAGLAIGATLVALILFAGPITGAGANPARYFGPALIAGRLGELVTFVAGPMFGAAAAAFLCGWLARGENAESEEPADAEADDWPPARTRRGLAWALAEARETEADFDAHDPDTRHTGDPLEDPEHHEPEPRERDLEVESETSPDSGRRSPRRRPTKPRGPRRDLSEFGAPEARLARAYELFHAGRFDGAASTIAPLLEEAFEADVADRAWALMLVIDGERADRA